MVESSHGALARHAIDAWESEGGSAPPGAESDRARTALPEPSASPRNNNAAQALIPASEEDRILRCLGAAVIMRWNTIPTRLQRELFDNASSVGELLQAGALKGQIARFLHKHKDDAARTCAAD